MKDKILLKIAGIIGIVFGALSCLTIIGLLWGIPMIIGGYIFYEYSNKSDEEIINHQSTILGWSIFFLIFSIIPGVLGLIYYFGITDVDFSFSKTSNVKDLENLKKLYDDNVITKEEFENKKQEILKRI